jgi:uncharacterized membrane protein
MNTQKFTVGTLVGGIAFFLLGYLFYGALLAGFFKSHANPAAPMRAMEDFAWWALILGNFAGGALLTWIFLKMGNVNSFSSGASAGAAIGFFLGLSRDLITYATSNELDLTATITDVIVGTVMTAIVGGIIAVVINRGKKA